MSIQFSAIIPTFNRANWLEKAILSVLEQSVAPLELIVVDDGSTDDTKKMVSKFDKVKYIYQNQKGPSAARNTGAKVAQGTHLAFLDSDDQWDPNKLKKQKEYLLKNPHLKCVYTNEIWIRNGKRINLHKHHYKIGGWIYLDCLLLCRISPSSIVILKELFIDLGGFDESLIIAEDYDLWLRLSAVEEIGYCDQHLIQKFGGHEDQLSRRWGMDNNRVYSLEKILNSKQLKEEYLLPTIDNLVSRLEVLIIGYQKHNKNVEANDFINKLDFWKNRKLRLNEE
jgi:glycosyltransferase involved in cell wall biosynthesis